MRNLHHQAQLRLRQSLGRRKVSLGAADCQGTFLLTGEKRKAADLCQVVFHDSLNLIIGSRFVKPSPRR
jgi:hypothetical protein